MQRQLDGRVDRTCRHVFPVFCDLDLNLFTAVILIDDLIVTDAVGIAVDGSFFEAIVDECAVLVIFFKRYTTAILELNIVCIAYILHIS